MYIYLLVIMMNSPGQRLVVNLILLFDFFIYSRIDYNISAFLIVIYILRILVLLSDKY